MSESMCKPVKSCPYVIVDCIPPVNCSIKQPNSKQKAKVVHISQLKRSLSVNRAIIIPNEDIDDFSNNSNKPQPLKQGWILIAQTTEFTFNRLGGIGKYLRKLILKNTGSSALYSIATLQMIKKRRSWLTIRE